MLCASPAYLQKNGTPQQPEELARHRCLRMKLPANRHRSCHLTNPENNRHEVDIAIDPAMLVNHTDTRIRACVDGAGISSQSIDLVANHLHSGELQRVLSPWITGTNTLYAALPSRKFIPKRASVFLEFMTGYTRTVIKKMEERLK